MPNKILKLSKNQINFTSTGMKNYLKCLFAFIQIPFVKFFYNQVCKMSFIFLFQIKFIKQVFFLIKMSYYGFLILFSYIILCDFWQVDYVNESKSSANFGMLISIWEVILIIWVLNFLLDEIIKVSINSSSFI